jgi:formate hydrogenlyase subunit 6/NADH:ubiquinone oxidoreductase subunit I
MTIDIKSKVLKGEPVTSLRCVGCGHCVDACRTDTLSYTTKFLGFINKHVAAKNPEVKIGSPEKLAREAYTEHVD